MTKNFDITNENIDKWTQAQFWEQDPTQSEELKKICLWVDWRERTATVETVIQDNSIPDVLYYGICDRYELAQNTDFKEFPEFYKAKVQPLLQDISNSYYEELKNSNWYGNKDESESDEEYISRVGKVLEEIPIHDMICYFGLYDLFEDYNTWEDGVISSLEEENIDLATVNLDDEDVLSEIVFIVRGINEDDTYVLLMSDEDVESEIRELQKEIQNE